MKLKLPEILLKIAGSKSVKEGTRALIQISTPSSGRDVIAKKIIPGHNLV